MLTKAPSDQALILDNAPSCPFEPSRWAESPASHPKIDVAGGARQEMLQAKAASFASKTTLAKDIIAGERVACNDSISLLKISNNP